MALIGLLATSTIIEHTHHLQTQAKFELYNNPGMQIRLEQDTMNALKAAMSRFLPEYVSHDMGLPTEYEFEFGLFFKFLTWTFTFTDITYTHPDLEIAKVKVLFTNGFDRPLLKIDFPAIKHLEINTKSHVNSWLLPEEEDLTFIIEDFDLDFQTNLRLDEKGYIDPIVSDVKINFGETKVEHRNIIIAFVLQ